MNHLEALEGFKEIFPEKHRSELKVPVRHVELFYKVRYFINSSGVGYCSLLTEGVKGKGLKGKVEAVAAKTYIGRSIFVFLSELLNGKKLITVPALYEKEPSFDEEVDLSDLIINTYYHNNLKRTPGEVCEEHMSALKGKKISDDIDLLRRDLLDLPVKGLEILEHIK